MQKHIQIKKKLVMTKYAEKSIQEKKSIRHSVPKNAEKSIKGKKNRKKNIRVLNLFKFVVSLSSEGRLFQILRAEYLKDLNPYLLVLTDCCICISEVITMIFNID